MRNGQAKGESGVKVYYGRQDRDEEFVYGYKSLAVYCIAALITLGILSMLVCRQHMNLEEKCSEDEVDADCHSKLKFSISNADVMPQGCACRYWKGWKQHPTRLVVW